MLKRTRKIILSIAGIVLATIVFMIYIWYTDTSKCIPEIPERINQIPETARWIGGCDGGHWYIINKMQPNENRYEIAIYFDYNGELYVNEIFKCQCQQIYNSREELFEKILYYEGEIKMRGDCDLIPVGNGSK